MNHLKCIKPKGINDPLLDKVEATYNDSFPPVERRDFSLVRNLLETEPDFTLLSLYWQDEYAGFITYWDLGGFLYVEHFALDPSARNGGVGSKAMQIFLSESELPVILEVEMPTDELSRRRIGFYERLGFVLDNTPYQQPPYRPDEGWFDMLLMAYGAIDLKKDFEKVRTALYSRVYGVK
ncbi:GNAT family N-acetyltransferase [Parabacteroides sp. OttesenSCG-928-K15]|nr:GNAT family N-acetyltransferase [Parabacteroides sp. OttesenSCG-928-K15]